MWTYNLSAQDIHFSQFYNSPLNLNPALAGVFSEDIRFIGNYRNQWESVPVPYLSFSGSYDTKVYNRIAPNGFFALGGIFNYDKQGDGSLALTQLSLTASYTHQVSDLSLLTAGFQIARENFENTSKTFLDFGTGLNLHVQTDEGFSINIGGGLFHLTKPQQNFYNQTASELPFRITGHVIGVTKLNDKMDLKFRLLSQFQGPYHEYLAGSALVYKLSDAKGSELAVNFGTNYRYADESDAVIPTLGVRYMMWYAELSYDINISQFIEATNGAGGPELSVIYTITKVKPPQTFKACPIF